MTRQQPSDRRTALKRTDRGQILIIFAVLVIVLIAICVLSIDVGRIFNSQAELQNAVDAAALAGASQLVGFVSTTEKTSARTQALQLAEANGVAGDPLTLADSDVVFGQYSTSPTPHFVPEASLTPGQLVDSIQITGRRTHGSPDGPIQLFFASIFGFDATAQEVRAVGTQPRRYVMFVMDRSGSMCFDTTNIGYHYSPNSNGSMAKSPSGWYWMPQYIYKSGWQTAWMYAQNDSTGATVTSFLPDIIKANLQSGTYFRYCSRDAPSTIQSGWLKAPSNVTIYSKYGSSYPNWSAQSYGPISSCDYAVANGTVEPINATQVAATAFVDLLNPDRERAGLVSYAGGSTLEYQLTDDFATLKQKIAAYDPREGTATPAGIKAGNDEFILSGRASGYGQRIMILLTDGMANIVNGTYYNNPSSPNNVTFCGETVSCKIYQNVATALETETLRARNNGIRIYTISFGADADRALMPVIARKTNGAYYYAPNTTNLTDIFVDIFHHLPPILTR